MRELPEPVENVDYYIERGEVILDMDGAPFDSSAWLQEKLRELGLTANGDPLRAGEKERPSSETTFEQFGVKV